MLDFLRRHQRYFFAIIATVIIISFSFFGVMNVMMSTPPSDPVAFRAVDGAEIKRRELDKMAYFLSTDAGDKLYFGGVNGPNFLNDGFIKRDLLETGVAGILIEQFQQLLTPDFKERFLKEQRYKPYHHPKADFISVENAWAFVAPDMRQNFRNLKNSESPFDQEAVKARVALFLGERKLSPQMLKEMLIYQKRQYGWLEEDPALYRSDLSLFGYHTTEDWFGPRFIRLAAAFLMNVAKEAERRGYKVTDDEALAALVQNAEKSYAENKRSQYMTAGSVDQYMKNQLASMQMTLSEAIQISREVLLYRRLVDGTSNQIMLDTLAGEQFADFAGQVVTGERYALPEALRLANFRDLQRLRFYVEATSDAKEATLPKKYLSAEEVAKSAPELVQREWKLAVASYDAGALQERVGVKEMWEWQTKADSFKTLSENFPELRAADARTEESRFAALESLSRETRERLDRFSREEIAKEHPDWIREALSALPKEERSVGIREAGDTPFEGVSDSRPLLQLLNQAAAGDKAAKEKLALYSQDGRHYFSMDLREEKSELSLMTFEEAKRAGAINELVKRKLEAYYAAIRGKNPELYRAANGDWKPFADVRQEVAKEYFKPLLKEMSPDEAAALYLLPYVKSVQEKLALGSSESGLVRNETEETTLANQWELVKTALRETRAKSKEENTLFAAKADSWTEALSSPDGTISFNFIRTKDVEGRYQLVLAATLSEKSALANEEKRQFVEGLLAEQEKSLNTLLAPHE